MPQMRRFEGVMQSYGKDNEQMRQMIRRFDEILSDKASKMAIHESEVYIEQNYVKKRYWDQL